MGYYTSYNMDVRNVKTEAEHEAIKRKLEELNVFGYALHDAEYSENNKLSMFWGYDEAKWYDHDEDMIRISECFPDATFKLYGTGEDPDDRWYTLYRNGKYETIHAEITWPDPTMIEWRD